MSEKVKSIKVTTPVGMLSFPALDAPDAGGKFDKDKFKTSLMIKKEDMKSEQGKALEQAVLKIGRQHFDDPKLTLKDFNHPLADGDEKNPEYNAGHIVMIAKNKSQPVLIGADKSTLNTAQINALKAGDFCRLVVSVYAHDYNGGGVALGLELVQFSHAGEGVSGTGRAAALELVDEIKVDLSDAADLVAEEPVEEGDGVVV